LQKISVVIITYNEERNIERCLQSALTIADEIVVVDSFSTDKTKEICAAYQVKFIENAFKGHIEQKNWAITQATYPHVLSLDADECPDETLLQSILEVKKNWTADAYSFNRCTNYCGNWIKHGSWYPDVKLRLWDSRKGHWTGENPHDRYEMSDSNVKILHIKGDLLHYSYYSVAEHITQGNKFSSIAAESMFHKGKKIGLISLIINPLWRFVRDYFFKLGFLDGQAGFIIAINTSHSTFLKYVKLYDLNKKNT
jgi:glycosyltransferase involved in cell wall biosynthesis